MAIGVAICIVILTTFGQLLLKQSARLSLIPGNRLKSLSLMLIGYCFFLITIFFSYQLMKLVPMKYFTVVMSVNYIAVLFAARFFIKEPLELKKVIGTILVAIGIFVFMT